MALSTEALASYHAARKAAAVRDLARERSRFLLRGKDRVRFLQGLTTNDVARLAAGQGCRAAVLSVKGRVVALLHVFARAEDFFVECAAACGPKVQAMLAKHAIMDDVEIVDRGAELGQLGLYGPGAREAVARALGVEPASLPASPYAHAIIGETLVARTDELGVPGLWLFVPLATMKEIEDGFAGVTPLADAAREALRIEARTPVYGVDLDEERLPLEAPLEDSVSHTKGCYLGQEVVARATARGHVNRFLVQLAVESERVPAPGDRVSAEGRDDAGAVTSACFSPSLDAPLALAYVHRSVWAPGTRLAIHAAGGATLPAVVRHGGPPASA